MQSNTDIEYRRMLISLWPDHPLSPEQWAVWSEEFRKRDYEAVRKAIRLAYAKSSSKPMLSSILREYGSLQVSDTEQRMQEATLAQRAAWADSIREHQRDAEQMRRDFDGFEQEEIDSLFQCALENEPKWRRFFDAFPKWAGAVGGNGWKRMIAHGEFLRQKAAA